MTKFTCLKVSVFYNRNMKGYYLIFDGLQHRGFCIAITKKQRDEIKHHLKNNFMPTGSKVGQILKRSRGREQR